MTVRVVSVLFFLTGLAACRREAPRAAPGGQGVPVAVPVSSAPRSAAAVDVIAVKGDVRVQRSGAGTWSSLSTGASLGPLDTVQAMGGGSARLRVRATGAELEVGTGTTIRLDAAAGGAETVRGRLVAHLSDRTQRRRLELSLPPGTLVLTTEPGNSEAEAAVEVDEQVTSVEARTGQVELRARSGVTVPIAPRQWARFDPGGSLVEQGGSGPIPELVEPADEARVRVRHTVTLRWNPVEGADAYRVTLRSAEIARRIDTSSPEVQVSVAAGEHRWAVQAIHGEVVWPLSGSRRLLVEVDHRPPELVVTEPVAGTNVVGPEVRFTGQTEAGAIVEIGRRRTTADARGEFALVVPVKPGLSNVVVSARDDVGNVRRVPRSVIWE